MRRESSTVVGLVGDLPEPLLTELSRSPNVSVIRAPVGAAGDVEAGARALQEAARRMSPYVVVAADPLAGVARAWQNMWDMTHGPQDATEFEQQSATALTAWRAGRFELPDYYLAFSATTEAPDAQPSPSFYLGPLRTTRPRRVTAVITGEGPEQAARIRQALRSLRHGPWWPPLPEIIEAARGFYAGGLVPAADQPAPPGTA